MRSKKPKTAADKAIELILRQNKNVEESSEDSDEDEVPRHEVDFDEYDEAPQLGATEIRKKNIKLLSEQSARYQGKIASRKHDTETDEEESGSEEAASEEDVAYEESDSEAEGTEKSQRKIDTEQDDEESDDGDEEDFDEEESGSDEASTDEDETAQTSAKKISFLAAEKNRQTEKGMCVQNQLKVWEKLLELRINSQKLLSKANQLPTTLSGAVQQDANQSQQLASQECFKKTATLLNSLLGLQNTLFKQFPELKNAMSNTLKRPLPLQARNSDDAPPTKRFAEELQARFEEIRPYRNTVLLKWDDRTKLLTPGAGAKKKMLTEEFDVIRKIDNALLNRSALIEKSQLLKHDAKATAATDDDAQQQQRNAEIYDDNDFYHQQLRELIEYKASSTQNNAEVMKQYVELQQLRQKMKKKVDTRASKGRKLRYVTHNKLINFMAPQLAATTWTEESKDELYKSLFLS